MRQVKIQEFYRLSTSTRCMSVVCFEPDTLMTTPLSLSALPCIPHWRQSFSWTAPGLRRRCRNVEGSCSTRERKSPGNHARYKRTEYTSIVNFKRFLPTQPITCPCTSVAANDLPQNIKQPNQRTRRFTAAQPAPWLDSCRQRRRFAYTAATTVGRASSVAWHVSLPPVCATFYFRRDTIFSSLHVVFFLVLRICVRCVCVSGTRGCKNSRCVASDAVGHQTSIPLRGTTLSAPLPCLGV